MYNTVELLNVDTSEIHYVWVPLNIIVAILYKTIQKYECTSEIRTGSLLPSGICNREIPLYMLYIYIHLYIYTFISTMEVIDCNCEGGIGIMLKHQARV